MFWYSIINWCLILYEEELIQLKMKRLFLLFILWFFFKTSISQISDFIILKKDHKTIKSFFAGSHISFKTADGIYTGQINAIREDSIFLTQFDIRQVSTNLGIYFLDTVATYKIVFNYKDIINVPKENTKGFNRAGSGASLFGGGIIITAVGLGTWAFTKRDSEYYSSPVLVGSGAALAGMGYLLLKWNNSKYIIGKKYQLEYVKVK